MNKTTRFIIGALLILGMLRAPVAATAEAEKITITGTCWIVTLLDSPDLRVLENWKGSTYNTRNLNFGLHCNYSVDALSGNWVSVVHSNDNPSGGAANNYTYTADENWVSNGRWDGHVIGGPDVFIVQVNGHNEYQGWLVKGTMEWAEDGSLAVDGELLIPGGE